MAPIADALMAGMRLRQYLDTKGVEAEKAQATVKLLKAQADGQAATAALHRNQLEQAMTHQSRLAQAFLLQGQGPEPLPGDQPGAVPPGPQSRLRDQLSPETAVPPEPIYSPQSGVGVLPTPTQEAAGFTQRFQGQDDQRKLQAFALKYGPQAQPQGEATPAASSVPSVVTLPSGGTGETSTRTRGATDPLGAPRGSSAVPQPGTLSSTELSVREPTVTQAIPQGQGQPASPLQMPAASVTATGPDDTVLLRNLSKAHFLNNQPREALAIFEYANQQTQLRNLASTYRSILADPGANEPQRRVALAGLGQALIRASQVEEGMKLFTNQLPLSSRQVIEQASVETRNILLEQSQAGQPLDVAAANKEAIRRKDASTIATRAPREPQTQVVETEQGVFVIDKATGQARQVTIPGTLGAGPTPDGTPQPLPGKRMTEGQAKAFGYGSRALQANTILGELEAQGVTGNSFAAYMAEQAAYIGGGLGAAGAAVLGIVTGGVGFAGVGAGTALGAGLGIALAEPLANMMRTPEEKLYAQARLDFLAAVLRKESGAAITNSEAAREEKRYFPQPGDSPQVIAQKRQARLGVLAVLSTEAGRPLALPQAPPQGTPQTPADAGIIPQPGGGPGTVRVPRQTPAAPAPPQRQVPRRLSELLASMSPETILGVSDAAIEGVTSPSDVPGLSVAQQRALLIRLQRRSQQGR